MTRRVAPAAAVARAAPATSVDPLAVTGRAPYRAAAVVAGAVWLGYILTLAPTVTFWDAGEFIAATRILGIPHPPGTPLFVLIAHVWALLVPVGEYAFRTNLLSALVSALGAGCCFLVVHHTLRPLAADLPARTGATLRVAGAAVAAFAGAFTFTNWQNSNETEVYAVATFTIAAMAWLVHVWREKRGTSAADRMLLLIVYLAGISISNHLLALLAGPAVVAFLIVTVQRAPAASAADRRREWATVALVAGVWALLIGGGLGSTTLTIAGGACFVAAAAFAATTGRLNLALMMLAIAAVGMTPYLYLYIRSAQHPMINEAAPATWDALLAVIRRAQYPVRTPLDDPTMMHGPDNPGRSLSIILLQLHNYVLYFDWQWAKGLGPVGPETSLLQLAATILFIVLGIAGSAVQRRLDRSAWWLLLMLFLVTGLGLVGYMNFRPGFSLGYDRYPAMAMHEVRERDYFFVVSFVVWGLWAGIGLTAMAKKLVQTGGRGGTGLATAMLAIGLIPLAANWSAATRKGPDARLAADFAYDLLNSVPPYGILFAYGDNDTFPLWWAQEVQGLRQDVTVVCLALANTDWYMRQLRDMPIRRFDPARAPAIWRTAAVPAAPTAGLHTMTDEEIAAAFDPSVIVALGRPGFTVNFGPFSQSFPPGTYPEPNAILSMRVVQQNIGKRPIVWASTTGREFAGLGRFVVQRGLGFALQTAAVDSMAAGLHAGGYGGPPLDVRTTERLAWETYRYAGLLHNDAGELETTSDQIARSLAVPFAQLASAAEQAADTAAMVRNLERSLQLSPNPAMRVALDALRGNHFRPQASPAR
ncbi:MAG: DUF2723 domain-containing protein [Gemmatimonadales bacterium]|nr:DUF2723 domain-containing protein [Gemmatimonadales bacterium]